MVIVAEIKERGGDSRRVEIGEAEATIGRTPDNAIVLPRGNVSKRHARIVQRKDAILIVDLKSTNGTYVNGQKITAPFQVDKHDRIYIGDFSIRAYDDLDRQLLAYVARDPVEHRLLAEIAGRDEAARAVYADWLEGRGELERAEFLRAQQEIAVTSRHEPRLEQLLSRVRELAASLDVPWRTRVARPPIEGCPVAFKIECPKDWSNLEPTDREDVRYCGSCKRRVYYALTIDDARHHARRDDCVALDSAALRWSRDLDPPYGRYVCPGCGLDVGPIVRECPRCRAEIQRFTMVGLMA